MATTTYGGSGTFRGRFRAVGAVLLLLALAATGVSADGEPGTIETVAGGNVGDGHAATTVGLYPRGMAVDAAGNCFITTPVSRIRRVDAETGLVSTFAGTGSPPSGGLFANAQVWNPHLAATGPDGDLYFTESGFGLVRRVAAATGVITTIAGGWGSSGFPSGLGGPATESFFAPPSALSVDGAGNVFLATAGYVFRVDAATGVIDWLSSAGGSTYAMAVDPSGNVYVSQSHRVLRRDAASGVVSTIAGTGEPGFAGDGGPATDALVETSDALAVDGDGNVFVTQSTAHRVRRIDAETGVIETVVGNGTAGNPQDSAGSLATEATVTRPNNLSVDGAGNLFFLDPFAGGSGSAMFVFRVDAATGVLGVHAGTGVFWPFLGVGGPATDASIPGTVDTATDAAGNVYFTCEGLDQVLRVEASSGLLTVFAGDGTKGSAGDGGPATEAQFSSPTSLAVDPIGNVCVLDYVNGRVRRVDALTGVVTTVLDLVQATGSYGQAIAVDAAGNLYVADPYMGAVYKREATTGDLVTFAGTYNPYAYGAEIPEGSLATEFAIEAYAVWVDPAGDVVIVDGSGVISGQGQGSSARLLKVDSSTGVVSVLGDVSGHQIIEDLVGDGDGNVFFAASGVVWRLDAATGDVTLAAGRYDAEELGDGGPATDALLWFPRGLWMDPSGDLYLADTYHQRVRKVNAIGVPLPAPSAQSLGESVMVRLGALLPTGDQQTDRKLGRAMDDVEESLDPAHWIDGVHLSEAGGRVFKLQLLAVERLEKVVDYSPHVQQAILDLADSARRLAETALAEAIAAGGKPKKIEKAQEQVDLAAEAAAAGDHFQAIAHFRKCWNFSKDAL